MKAGVVLLLLVTLCCGCNTVAGVGKDLKRGGEVLEDAAKKNQ